MFYFYQIIWAQGPSKGTYIYIPEEYCESDEEVKYYLRDVFSGFATHEDFRGFEIKQERPSEEWLNKEIESVKNQIERAKDYLEVVKNAL